MFKLSVYILLAVLPVIGRSQTGRPIDSINPRGAERLYKQLALANNDSSRMMSLDRLGFYYERLNSDSSLKYFHASLDMARQKSYRWAESRVLAGISGLMEHQGKYAEAFELLFQSLKIAEEINSVYDIARANRRISGIYFELQSYPKAVAYLLKALSLDNGMGYEDKAAVDHYALADAYEKMNQLDSATFYVQLAIRKKNSLQNLMQYVYPIDGHVQQKRGNYKEAAASYRKGMEEARLANDLVGSSQICADFSALYQATNRRDSAIIYALKGFDFGKKVGYKKGIMLNGNLLAALYDSAQPSLAITYHKVAAAAKDSLYGMNSIRAIQDLVEREATKQRELEEARVAFKNKLRLYGLLAGLAAVIIIAGILYNSNRHKQKTNVLLQQQKAKVEATLGELKSTQAQLIQSEKMASLGQLTAGIAHEIQNPLNFVNNFSEINNELIEELKRGPAAVGSPAVNQEKATSIDLDLLNDIYQNNEKIVLHGKRADAIVKGMLEHSRQGTGQKQLTDINALADEYLKLAYHGMRAKDKDPIAIGFNATIKTDFDKSIGKINIVSQDMGRVLLNLYNNAFYAVKEKQAISRKLQAVSYEPVVTVTTRKDGNRIIITVADNGIGIPQNVIGKIFQPFFTTKPTGQGTGLGLSLAYDIVKAHGGEIKADNTGGTAFIIQLPL